MDEKEKLSQSPAGAGETLLYAYHYVFKREMRKR